jgi:hypothetical protein
MRKMPIRYSGEKRLPIISNHRQLDDKMASINSGSGAANIDDTGVYLKEH